MNAGIALDNNNEMIKMTRMMMLMLPMPMLLLMMMICCNRPKFFKTASVSSTVRCSATYMNDIDLKKISPRVISDMQGSFTSRSPCTLNIGFAPTIMFNH